MKKGLYLLAALTLAASSAFASKARQAALSNTTAITDVQSIFSNPADVHYVGDFATFEMGDKDLTTAGPHAEGGFLKSMGDSKLGFYLGRVDNATALRQAADTVIAAAAKEFLRHENSFELFYGAKAGDLNWAVSFGYSNSNVKGDTSTTTDNKKQSAMGTRVGVKTDAWGAYADIGLLNTAKSDDAEFKGKAGLTLGGHYIMNTMKFIAKYDMVGGKATVAGTDAYDADKSIVTLGFTNAWKNEGNMAFYGLAYKMTTDKEKVGDTKTVSSEMPFTLGAEVLSTSWMKLRGSVTQNLLLGSTKVTTGTGTTGDDTVSHNTKTAAGAGFVWGKNNLDVVLVMGTNGSLNGATFGTNASYTYMF